MDSDQEKNYISLKMIFKKLVQITCVLIISANALAETYWIDSRAKGKGNGSLQKPYNSFKQAIEARGGGQTYIFKPGLYNNGQLTLYPRHKGSPQNPTVLKSQEKYKALLHGSAFHGVFVKGKTPWVIIDGFEISGARFSGVKSLADYTVIRNCFIHNNVNQGIEAHNVNHCVFENNLIEFNGQHPSYQHGIYADGNSLTIRNNIIRCNACCGLALGSALSDSLIIQNLIHDNGGWGLEWDSTTIGNNRFIHNTISNNALGLAFSNGSKDTVINNIITYNFRPNDPKSVQIQHRRDSDFNGIMVENNIIYPASKPFTNNNSSQEPHFLDPSKGLFFLKKKTELSAKKITDLPEKDFFGSKWIDPNQMDIGCFSYDPNLLEPEYQKKWYNGWPYYFRKGGNTIPDLWKQPNK